MHINTLTTNTINGFKCNKCGKIYKLQGKCLKKHLLLHYPELIM